MKLIHAQEHVFKDKIENLVERKRTKIKAVQVRFQKGGSYRDGSLRYTISVLFHVEWRIK